MSSDADVAVLKVEVEHLAKALDEQKEAFAKELDEQKQIVSELKKAETNKLRAAAVFLGSVVLSLGAIIFLVATGFDPTGQNKP